MYSDKIALDDLLHSQEKASKRCPVRTSTGSSVVWKDVPWSQTHIICANESAGVVDIDFITRWLGNEKQKERHGCKVVRLMIS
jgi:hypothetical protein